MKRSGGEDEDVDSGEGEEEDEEDLWNRYFYHFDMLRDVKRNKAYRKAIEKEVIPGKSICLDIGTGSGLLACLCANAHAASVFACEVDTREAVVAHETIDENSLSEIITLIPVHSKNLGEHLPVHPDIIVGELLDTGLIGEGVLKTMRHAADNLAAPHFKSIPCSAVVYGKVLQCRSLWERGGIRFSETPASPTTSTASFPGQSCSAVLGSRLSQQQEGESVHASWFLDQPDLIPLTEDFSVFAYDFQNPALNSSTTITCTAAASGTAHCILTWWVAQMTSDGTVLLDTCPGSPPPDHWRQAVYYLQKPHIVHCGEEIVIHASHDEDSIHVWLSSEGPDCYGPPSVWPPQRCAQQNAHWQIVKSWVSTIPSPNPSIAKLLVLGDSLSLILHILEVRPHSSLIASTGCIHPL
ncbi:arginine N-methyltransferase [Pelomyxa schiedti]|nr:arginine N-methyltransferase [Pelomyxa schiedti]